MTAFSVTTVTDCLLQTAEAVPHNGLTIYSRQGETDSITYADLWEQSRKFAAYMIEREYTPGTRVGLFIPTSISFFVCYFGCLMARLTPVTLAGSLHFGRLNQGTIHRLASIVMDQGFHVLLDGYGLQASEFDPEAYGMGHIPLIDMAGIDLNKSHRGIRLPTSRREDLALIQYTSGSLSRPKGVMLSQKNISANIQAIVHEVNMNRSDTINIWIPLYHDMGLIGSLSAITSNGNLRLCAPDVFLFDPLKWLFNFASSGSTINPSPHFFFRMLNHAYDSERVQDIDLSGWRVAFNGAETIHARDLQRFMTLYGPHGFRETSMYPVYGLAEASLAILFPSYGTRADVVTGQSAFGEHCDDIIAHREFVSVGRAITGHKVRIAPLDQETINSTFPTGVGQIMAKGPSIMQGYLNKPELTQETLTRDGWLMTGDLGFEHNGSIYVCGRIKEIIILRGGNYFPEDFEFQVDTCKSLKGLEITGRAAFAWELSHQETVGLALEIKNPPEKGIPALLQSLKDQCAQVLGVDPTVLWLRPKTIPRTTSGKNQRLLLAKLLNRKRIEPLVVLPSLDLQDLPDQEHAFGSLNINETEQISSTRGKGFNHPRKGQ